MSELIQATITSVSSEQPSKITPGETFRIVNVSPHVSPETARILGANEYRGKFELRATVSSESMMNWYLARKGTVINVTATGKGGFEVNLDDNDDLPVVQTQQPPPDLPASSPEPVNGTAPASRPATYQGLNLNDALVRVYEYGEVIRICIHQAQRILEDTGLDYSTEDIRALALTMAIEAKPYHIRQNPVPDHPVMTAGMMVWQPRSPELVIEHIRDLAGKYTNIPQDKTESIRRGFMAVFTKLGLNDELRYRFCNILFGETSSKKLTPSQMLAISLWSHSTKDTNYRPSITALQEMSDVLAYAEVHDVS